MHHASAEAGSDQIGAQRVDELTAQMVGWLQEAASGISADSQITLEDARRYVEAAGLLTVSLRQLFRYFALEAVEAASLRGADSVDQAVLTLFLLGELNLCNVERLVGDRSSQAKHRGTAPDSCPDGLLHQQKRADCA